MLFCGYLLYGSGVTGEIGRYIIPPYFFSFRGLLIFISLLRYLPDVDL
jgi:hypothetical protein